jgi:hypothetical protein
MLKEVGDAELNTSRHKKFANVFNECILSAKFLSSYIYIIIHIHYELQ